jgi:hypothetical protein
MKGTLARQQVIDNSVNTIDLAVKQALDPGLLKQEIPD